MKPVQFISLIAQEPRNVINLSKLCCQLLRDIYHTGCYELKAVICGKPFLKPGLGYRILNYKIRMVFGAGEMTAQRLGVFASLLEDPSSFPEPVSGSSRPPITPAPRDLRTHVHAQIHIYP